jgi:hypothetical protein
MQIEGLRIAKFTAKHSLAVQVIAEPHAWVPWMLRGALRGAFFQHHCLAQKKTSVYPSVSENKNSGLRPVGFGRM